MTTPTNAADGVHELVSQREQLRAWIAKLDEVQTGAPSRVAQRVRADYEDRLRRVTEDLSAHAEEVQGQLESLRGELEAAEERRAHAADALEEMRLRHLIGELDAGAWDRARSPLEADVATAEEALARTRGEVERLSVLSGEIGGGAFAMDESGGAQAGADVQTQATADFGGDEEAQGDEEPLPVFAYAPEDDAGGEPGAAIGDDEADAAVSALDAFGDEPQPEAAAEPDGDTSPVSGEELAAWISEVESEATLDDSTSEPAVDEPAPPPVPQDDAEGWDPFANEFGGAPANPTTQPGDAAQDLPWLDSIEGGAAGRWSAPAQGEGDELAFLEQLEPAAPAAEEPAASDLAADDLAFLEELDRAISGGSQRPAQPQASADAVGLGNGFAGGSGDSATTGGAGEGTQEQPRKRGEALLCKECGAINEPQAWYCEICGSEL
ncbi:hypothetical protein [Longimicrobium sp.]|uniref:hypothetical protein n=1 Tax=Longimicrobium sp. TaxID=2029185 RepID=UPI002B9FB408|nr:hypothetical protein [Longimicrobium sp.]HSU12724.1 hypothetical protein [Longimicrobium sp.]